MNPARGSAIDPDLRKLLLIIAAFNWTALLLLARRAPLDYVAFFTAGHLVASGQGRSLFDLATQTNFQTVVLGKSGTLPYYHLAYEALVFAPLSLLPFALSLWMYRLIVGASIYGICRISAQIFQLKFSDTFLLVMSFLSVATAFAQGQDSLILLLCIAICFWLLMKDRDMLAGAFLSFALFKPQLIIPVAAILAWKRRGRFTAAFSIGGALTIVTSTLLTGFSGWRQWQQLVKLAGSGSGREIGASANWMANIRGLLNTFIHSGHELTAVTVTLSVVVGGITLYCLRKFTDPRDYLPAASAMSLLVSYHSNIHDLAILLIPILSLVATKTRTVATHVCLGLCFVFPFFLALGIVPYFAVIAIFLWILTLHRDHGVAFQSTEKYTFDEPEVN